jgi:hypothetical protein
MSAKQTQNLILLTGIVMTGISLLEFRDPANLTKKSAHGVAKRLIAIWLFVGVTYAIVEVTSSELVGYIVLLILVAYLVNKTPEIKKEFKSAYG